MQRNIAPPKPTKDLPAKDLADVNFRGNTPRETMTGTEELKTEMDDSQFIRIRGWKINRVIAITHLNIFLYATCFWIQNGTLPYLSKKLGVDPVMFGYLQTTFAVVQLAGGPLFGRFGDLFGGRAAMTLAFLSSTLSYFLLGMSTNIPILFISRLPSLFMHAMQGGQMIVTDIGDASQRADALGKLGMSYGVGMVVGPLIGGILTKVLGEQIAAFIASAGSLLSVALVLMFVPQHTKKADVQTDTSEKSIFNLKKIIQLIMGPGALFLLLVRLASGVPIGVFQSMFQVVALNTFNLAPDQNGYLMSYIGITSMVVQGIGLGVVTKKFSESKILKWSTFILVWSYLLLSFVTNVRELCLVSLPLVVGLTTQNVIISSSLTKTVADADTGAMLGVNMAVNSLVRSVSPTLGGYMLENIGFHSFGYLGFVTNAVVTIVLFWKFRSQSSTGQGNI
ncbi:solute carrier family 22 member 18-like [Haliotis asinina]|uniref:solute carrier family 22 member 18-like n=1 Tax=Haliotis asinina TaxID=109174 RepID=UPI003532086C